MKKILFIITLLVIMPILVEAKYNYRNVLIEEKLYQQLLENYTENEIDNFSEYEISILRENPKKIIISEEKYFMYTYGLDINKNIVYNDIKEVSKDKYINNNKLTTDEYLNAKVACSTNCSEISTNYKVLRLTISPDAANSATVRVLNTWKNIPTVKSYDIVGFRTKQTSNIAYLISTYSTYQKYDEDYAYYNYNTSGNTVGVAGGIAQIMNIVNSTSTTLENSISIRLYGSNVKNGLIIYGSYQHSINYTNTLADMKSVTFGATCGSGYQILGSTYIYANTYANNLDKMAGVSVTYDSTPF